MKSIMEKLDPKLITSAGGIVLAGLVFYGYMQLSNSRITEVISAVKENTQAILEMAKATNSNTDAIRQSILSQDQLTRSNANPRR